MRKASVYRKTTETDITLDLSLEGNGRCDVGTKIPFMDHMFALWAKHGNFDISIQASGDIEVDMHHTVEDLGICLGQALNKALGDRKGINRYGYFLLPMDEALCTTVIDISGRPYLRFSVKYPANKTGDFDTALVHEFFQALVVHAGLTLHIEIIHGENVHHIIEAIFKSFARSLARAVEIDPRWQGIPSTKGIL